MDRQSKEWYDKLFPNSVSKAEAFDKIAELYFDRNFGTLPKAELELLLFSEYMDRLYAMEGTSPQEYSDYAVSMRLGLTQSRVNALKQRKEIKYPSSFDWKKEFRKVVTKADFKDDRVRVYIRDVRLYSALMHEIEMLDSYSEASLTKQLLLVSPPVFVDLMINSYDTGVDQERKEREELRKELQKILQENGLDAEAYITEGSLGKTLKKVSASVAGNVLLSVLNAIPIVGSGLYDSGKEIIEAIKEEANRRKEIRKR